MQLLKEQFVEHWQGLHLLNPFTAPACKNFWAERCMDVPANSISAITSYPIQTVYLPLLYKQYICHSYTNSIFATPIPWPSTFNVMCFNENPFTCQCKKEDKTVKGFKFCTLIGRFQVTSWQ